MLGLAAGVAAVAVAQRRFQTIRNLTLPMKSFLVTSSGTFIGIIAADHASRNFETQQNAEKLWYENREERLRAEESHGLTLTERAFAFARREKYKIIGATWIASMVGSFVLVGRNPYISGQQKIVQARVYAQGLTLGVLCASAAFEISDQRRGRGILDAAKKEKSAVAAKRAEAAEAASSGKSDEGDLWKDMVAAEEQRLKSKHQSLSVKQADTHNKKNEKQQPAESHSGEKDEGSETENSEAEEDSKAEKAPAQSKQEKA